MTTQDARLAQRELFRSYKAAPTLAVPTVLLFLAVIAGISTTWYNALNGNLSLWVGCLINGVLSYGLFSIIHDSSHRAISSNRWINDGIGTVGLIFLFPYAPMPILRWLHMQHHRFTNSRMDPDLFTHEAPWWQAPFRWAFFDAYYMYYYFKYGGKYVRKFAPTFAIYLGLLIPALATAIYFGYGLEVLLLWFIPTRIALFLIDVVFVILPHHPGIVSEQEDPYLATTMRMGWEWLLTPFLVYQNYHLIHHLFPTVPFYKMHRVWDLKRDELTRHNISYQSAFGLQPQNIALHREFRDQHPQAV